MDKKKRIKCDSETRETYFSITFAFGTNMALTMPPTNIIKSQPMIKMVVCFLGRIWIMYKNRCWKKHLRWKKTKKSRQVVPKLKNTGHFISSFGTPSSNTKYLCPPDHAQLKKHQRRCCNPINVADDGHLEIPESTKKPATSKEKKNMYIYIYRYIYSSKNTLCTWCTRVQATSQQKKNSHVSLKTTMGTGAPCAQQSLHHPFL